MKVKLPSIEAAIARGAKDVPLILLYGNDEAAARALAARLGEAMGLDAERIDLDPATLKTDPGRLADEAASLSLFGGARYIRIAGAGEECTAAIQLLLQVERTGNPVIAIAGALKATGGLLKLTNAAPGAMVCALYQPEGRDAGRLAIQLAKGQGLQLDPVMAERIVAGANGDRAVVASELEKIACYLDAAPDRLRDVDAAVLDAIGIDDGGDGASLSVIEAALAGQGARVAADLARIADTGQSSIPILRAAVRRLMTIAEIRTGVDGGEQIEVLMKRARVFWKEEASTARLVRSWSPEHVAKAITLLREAERQVMAPGTAGDVVALQQLMQTTRAAARLMRS